MNKNILYVIIGIVIVGVIAVVLLKNTGDDVMAPTPTATLSFTSASPTVSPTTSATTSASPTTSTTTTPATSTTITYTDAGFAPTSVSVKAGSTIIFKNSSTKDMWPASAMHPKHLEYPEQSTCFAGKFTGCNVAPGGTYSMKFNAVGMWKYHDHLNSSKTGTIVVTQ